MRWIDMHCDTVSEIYKNRKRNADEKYIVRRYGTA